MEAGPGQKPGPATTVALERQVHALHREMLPLLGVGPLCPGGDEECALTTLHILRDLSYYHPDFAPFRLRGTVSGFARRYPATSTTPSVKRHARTCLRSPATKLFHALTRV